MDMVRVLAKVTSLWSSTLTNIAIRRWCRRHPCPFKSHTMQHTEDVHVTCKYGKKQLIAGHTDYLDINLQRTVKAIVVPPSRCDCCMYERRCCPTKQFTDRVGPKHAPDIEILHLSYFTILPQASKYQLQQCLQRLAAILFNHCFLEQQLDIYSKVIHVVQRMHSAVRNDTQFQEACGCLIKWSSSKPWCLISMVRFINDFLYKPQLSKLCSSV